MSRFSSFFLSTLFFCINCQSIPKSNLKEIPEGVDNFFSSCLGEGEIEASLFEQDLFLLRNNVSFFSDQERIDIEILGLFDEYLQSLQFKGNSLYLEGRLTDKLRPLQVDTHGFLTWNGHALSISTKEIGCLLRLRLPQGWSHNYTSLYLDQSGTHLYRKEQNREIHLLFTSAKYCVDVSWYGFWIFLKRTISWCVEGEGKKALTLRGINGYHIVLKPLESTR